MKKKYIYFLLWMLLIALNHTYSQNTDIAAIKNPSKFDRGYCYSSFDNLMTNPAFTGNLKGQTFAVEAGIHKPLLDKNMLYHAQTYSFIYEISLGSDSNQSGLGLSLSNNKDGITSGSPVGIYLSQSQRFKTKSRLFKFHELSLGISATYSQEVFQFQRLTYGDMIDPRYGFVNYTAENSPPISFQDYLGVSHGVLYRNSFSYLSIGCNNFLFMKKIFIERKLPYKTQANKQREYNISAGLSINLNNGFNLGISAFSSLYFDKLVHKNQYSPSITAIYKDIIFTNLCYRGFSEPSIKIGGVLFGKLMLSVEYAISEKKRHK